MELMPILSQEEYALALQKLYPPGQYFETIFEDPEHELTLYIEGLAASTYRVQLCMSQLIEEAYPDRCSELINAYEVVFELDPSGELQERQNAVMEKWIGLMFRPVDWDKIGAEFGFTLTFKRQRTFSFGDSVFEERLWDIAARSYLIFFVSVPLGTSSENKASFEAKMNELSPPNYYLEFEYKEVE